MEKVAERDYAEFIPWARMNTSNQIYPLSIAEGYQAGDIYVDEPGDPGAVFFWHYCGFAYISGQPSEDFLGDIITKIPFGSIGRRLVLITDDQQVVRYFAEKDFAIGSIVEYMYSPGGPPKERVMTCPVTDRFRIEPIDRDNISRIEGKIIPSFSWENADRFLKHGFGYVSVFKEKMTAACQKEESAARREIISAVAFSAGVSSGEIDIGVETRPEYRGCGLAAALAGRMCEHIIEIGKRPVWAHAAHNTGSGKVALKCGFVEQKVNAVIKQKGTE